MRKKIWVPVATIFILLLATLVSGCSRAASPSSLSLPTGSQSPTTSVAQVGLTIKVTQPVDGSSLNTSSVIVKGQTKSGATVNINDQIGTADKNGNFSITVKLVNGPNVLNVLATDSSGNRGEVILMVNVNLPQVSSTPGLSALPQGNIPLKVIAPTDGATLNTTNITVRGQTAPNAAVIVNDQVGTADEQGNFSIAVSLENGLNIINVTASDEKGNQVEVILMVNVTGS